MYSTLNLQRLQSESASKAKHSQQRGPRKKKYFADSPRNLNSMGYEAQKLPITRGKTDLWENKKTTKTSRKVFADKRKT